MHNRYNRLRIKALSERGKRMAKARWDADRLRRDSEMPERIAEMQAREIENLPKNEGDMIGVLQWTCADTGKVRRWIVRISDRRDRITVESPGEKRSQSHGWSWFLTNLRKHLV